MPIDVPHWRSHVWPIIHPTNCPLCCSAGCGTCDGESTARMRGRCSRLEHCSRWGHQSRPVIDSGMPSMRLHSASTTGPHSIRHHRDEKGPGRFRQGTGAASRSTDISRLEGDLGHHHEEPYGRSAQDDERGGQGDDQQVAGLHAASVPGAPRLAPPGPLLPVRH